MFGTIYDDKNSNVTSFTNRAGDMIYYEYDALNRMSVKNRLTDVNENSTVVSTYEYDYLGRRISGNRGRYQFLKGQGRIRQGKN